MMRKVLEREGWYHSLAVDAGVHRNTWLAWSMRCFRGTWFT